MESTLAPTLSKAGARPSATPDRRAWIAFGAVLAASVMDLLDSTIASVASPAIRADLGGSYSLLQWIGAAYTLAMAVTLLVGGRLGDMFGRKRVLLWGMAGFTAASLLCALAPSPGVLIGCRALQGALGAVMLPQCSGLIRDLFGEEGTPRAFGVFGPVMGIAAVAGPVLGGALIDANVASTGWRLIFLVNVPVGLAALLVGGRMLPAGAPSARAGRLDGLSIVLAAGAAFLLIFPLVQGRQLGWPLWIVGMLVASVPVGAAFAFAQRRTVRRGATALLEPGLFGRRAYVAGLAFAVFFIGAMGAVGLTLNVLLQTGLGYTPLAASIATLTFPAGAIVGTIVASLVVARLGRRVLQLGLSLMACGLVVLAVVVGDAGTTLGGWAVAGPMLLAGIGMGMIFMPMFDTILFGMPERAMGSASGLLQATQQLAMSLGLAVIGTLFFAHVGAHGGPGRFVGAAHKCLLWSAGLLGVAFLAVFALPRHTRG
jgi:EmrB/QacA subfamily drug resistance transporter